MSVIGEVVARQHIAKTQQQVIGRYVRRTDVRTGAKSPWARIANFAPSPDGQCWLVSLWDGEVDVWRVDSTDFTYEFTT